ncbi:hypothetical protein [Aureimonas sp. Leaf324]|jgi:hypothetical protein|uniref:hypothetical protein n=1 Tax=Aureimonas sp. Leaf324 TaxID=1736336 RepID=UPI000701B073|nr:hypothetical protein [Aureimonas sp. Leaf324]KQQ85849.1 hypothetical protein ASF65_04750 [Aureimonas sp. Leaf324]
MKEWLTAQEIADANLPQMPATKRGVNDLAEREGWNADEFRSRILAFGVPTAIKTDNGSDFVAKEINRLFAHLDIEPIRSNA